MKLVFAMLVLLSFKAGAADAVKKAAPEFADVAPTEIRKLGQPLEWDMADGRVAGLYQGQIVSYEFPVKIGLAENECSAVRQASCVYYMPSVITIYEVRWSKHPNPDKIGKVVQNSFDSMGAFFPLGDGYLFMGTAHSKANYPLTQNLAPDRMACDSWDWLGAKPAELNIVQLASEAMFYNGETGQAENRTIAAATDLKFQLQPDGIYGLKSFGDMVTAPNFVGGNFIAGEIIRMDIEKGSGDVCLSSFKVDFSGTSQADAEKKVRSQFDPYLYEAAENYKNSFIFLQFLTDGKAHAFD